MKNLVLVLSLLSLVACGPRRPGKVGATGENGADGISAGVDIRGAEDACSNGGVVLSAFKDYNNDGMLDVNEPVSSVKTVCNGVDGLSSSVSLDSLSVGSSQCAQGGVSISSVNDGVTSSVTVCNGASGLNGEQGLQGLVGAPGVSGPQGPQGPAGVNGSTVTPVKFCSASNAQFPEYGLKLGNDVFAVYWTGSQAFLAKLLPKTYVTTTGTQDCQFTIL